VGVMTWLFAHLFCDWRGESCSSTNSYVPINEQFFVSEQFLCAVVYCLRFACGDVSVSVNYAAA
jgi:hypothetical protein